MGWITANRENISIHKEVDYLSRYIAWVHEDANLSRRAHSLLIQHTVMAAALFVAWVVWACTSTDAYWLKMGGLAACAAFWLWPQRQIERANKRVRDHEENRPVLLRGECFMAGHYADPEDRSGRSWVPPCGSRTNCSCHPELNATAKEQP